MFEDIFAHDPVVAQRLSNIIEAQIPRSNVMITATTTIDVMDAVIAIQSARQDDSNDVALEQLYSSDDVDAIALAAKRTGCFVTFDYTDGEEIRTIEVY